MEPGEDLVAGLAHHMRAYQAGTETLVEAAAARFGISRSDHHCLDILDRAGPMTATHLAEASGLTNAAITGVLDRLEEAGYVRRTRDTRDRRRVFAEVTDAARAVGDEVFGPLLEDSAAVLRTHTAAELQIITAFLDTSAALTLRHAARIRALSAEQEPPAPPNRVG